MKGSKGISAIWIVAGIVALLFFTGVLSVEKLQNMFSAVDSGSGEASACEVNPSLVTVATDALTGNAVTATGLYMVNGGLTATAPTTKGDVRIIYRATGYINQTASTTLGCGSNPLSVKLYKWTAPSISIYNDAKTDVLTNAVTGGAINETVKAFASSYNWKFHVTGTSLTSTGDMIVVIDFTSTSANVSSVTMSGATKVEVPSGYTSQTSGGAVYAFKIPAQIGNTESEYNIQVQAKTDKIISDTVYTRTYSLSPFWDTIINPSMPVTDRAFNDAGTSEVVGTTDYNFCIGSYTCA